MNGRPAMKKRRGNSMSYLNNQVGYRDELLMTRSVVKKENYDNNIIACPVPHQCTEF